ncbi:MAG: ankyrin repeat domain-containing protein [Candidatus Cardinium sp.]|nr:MAG: ankyrin repeat domain-containing protein [Candidatus Cardinium sp.]
MQMKHGATKSQNSYSEQTDTQNITKNEFDDADKVLKIYKGTELHLTCLKGDLKQLERLCKDKDLIHKQLNSYATFNYVPFQHPTNTPYQYVPLHLAIKSGKPEIVAFLLTIPGINVKAPVESLYYGPTHVTALHLAIHKFLQSRGKDLVDKIFKRPSEKRNYMNIIKLFVQPKNKKNRIVR